MFFIEYTVAFLGFPGGGTTLSPTVTFILFFENNPKRKAI